MPTLGIPELMIVLVIVVLLFGASRLPQLGKSLGEGIRFFRQGVKGDEEEEQEKLQD